MSNIEQYELNISFRDKKYIKLKIISLIDIKFKKSLPSSRHIENQEGLILYCVSLRDKKEKPLNIIAVSLTKTHDGSYQNSYFSFRWAKTRYFGSTKSCDGISATELHGEFRTMYFGLDSPGRKEKLYPRCRRRWKVLYARSHSDYRENGSGK